MDPQRTASDQTPTPAGSGSARAVPIRVAHRPGPDRRALVVYLLRRGYEVTVLDDLEALLTTPPESLRAAVVDGSLIPTARVDELESWLARTPRGARVVALAPAGVDVAMLGRLPRLVPFPSPYFLEELVRRLESGWAPEPLRRGASDSPWTWLVALGRSLAAELSSARGWLALARESAEQNERQTALQHAMRELDLVLEAADRMAAQPSSDGDRFTDVDLEALLRRVVESLDPTRVRLAAGWGEREAVVRGIERDLNLAMRALLQAELAEGAERVRVELADVGGNGAVEVRIHNPDAVLEAEQLAQLRVPGVAISYNGVQRGTAYPLADEILKRHGASLQVESRPGLGTAVTIILDAARGKSGSRRDQRHRGGRESEGE